MERNKQVATAGFIIFTMSLGGCFSQNINNIQKPTSEPTQEPTLEPTLEATQPAVPDLTNKTHSLQTHSTPTPIDLYNQRTNTTYHLVIDKFGACVQLEKYEDGNKQTVFGATYTIRNSMGDAVKSFNILDSKGNFVKNINLDQPNAFEGLKTHPGYRICPITLPAQAS